MSTDESRKPGPARPDPMRPNPYAANPPGRTSFIIAIVMVVCSLVFQGVTYFLPFEIARNDLSYEAVSWVVGAGSVVSGLLAVAAVVFGIIGLTRPHAGRAMAGAGTALGAATLVNLVISTLLRLSVYVPFDVPAQQ